MQQRSEEGTGMSDAAVRPGFPPAALLGAAVLIGLSVLAAVYGRIAGAGVTLPPSHPIAERSLRFEDRTDGGITVVDAADNRRVSIVAPGTNGFLRATVRGLAQQRLRQDIDGQVPFQLAALSDGRLTLTDPATGRRIDLEAFGATNEQAFAHLLKPEAAP
jgi:putative photosynthetic complex assembly protein